MSELNGLFKKLLLFINKEQQFNILVGSGIVKCNKFRQQQLSKMDLSQQLSQTQQKTDHLGSLLTDQIGYGQAQQKLSRSLYLLLFSQGCQSVALGLLLPVLTHQWQLTTFQQSLIITVVYLGVAAGSYLQVYSDRYGRYSFIMYDAILQSFFGILSCLCWNFSSFLFTRFFYGVGIGICLPLSASYITQISPSYMRATLLTKSRLYWSAGCLFACILGWIFLRSQSWRTLLLFICLPGLYALYQHHKYGRQSLRFLWVQKKGEQVCELIQYMCNLNDRPQVDKSYILALMNSQIDKPIKEVPISAMFGKKYYGSSIRLISSWFTVCFIYYGIMLLLPTILERVFERSNRNANFKYIFLIVISIIQVAGFYLSTSAMDHPKIGRKKAVYYGFVIVFFGSLIILIFGQQNMLVLFLAIAVIKFIITATFMVLYPYTAEIYETMIRGKALGICSMAGRLSTTLIGVVGVQAINWFGGQGLYMLFFGLSFVSGYGASTMPFCTGNRPIS